MSRRLIVSGNDRPRELVLVGTLTVGRDPACDISDAADPLLSRRHAAFTSTAKEVAVRDLGSRNGILVNGVKTPESVLRGGDVVQIGQLQVKFVDEVGPFLDVPGAEQASAQTFAPSDTPTRAPDSPPETGAATVLLEVQTVVTSAGPRTHDASPAAGGHDSTEKPPS